MYCPFVSIRDIVTSAELLAVKVVLDLDVSNAKKSTY